MDRVRQFYCSTAAKVMLFIRGCCKMSSMYVQWAKIFHTYTWKENSHVSQIFGEFCIWFNIQNSGSHFCRLCPVSEKICSISKPYGLLKPTKWQYLDYMYMFKRNNYTFINGRRSTQSHITISMHAVGDTQKYIMSIKLDYSCHCYEITNRECYDLYYYISPSTFY